nr:centrosomal protein of 70 kDa [Hydra vulgaris]
MPYSDGYTILDSKSSDLLRRNILHLLQENECMRKAIKEQQFKNFNSNNYSDNRLQIKNHTSYDKKSLRKTCGWANFGIQQFSKCCCPKFQEGLVNKCDCHNFVLGSEFCKDVCVFYPKLEKYKKKYKDLKAKKMNCLEESAKLNHTDIHLTNLNKLDVRNSDICQDLYTLIKELVQMVTPWQKVCLDYDTSLSLLDLKDILKKLIDATHKGPQKDADQNKYLVEHYMHLFNIRNIEWVYTHMYNFYAKFKTLENGICTIRNILNMNSTAKLNNIIDAIGQLVRAKDLLYFENIDRLIKDIKRYEQFYKSFNDMVNQLLEILDVEYPENIVPSVKRLISYG